MNDLTGFLDKRTSEEFMGSSILLSDSATFNSNFLVHYFISQPLKDGHAVCLVSFSQSLTHYTTIAAKLGVNITRLQQQGRFVYVDCLTNLLQGSGTTQPVTTTQPGTTGTTGTSTAQPLVPAVVTLDCRSLSLKVVYDEVCTVLERMKQHRPVCLVLDGLSVLLSIGVPVDSIVTLCQYCRLLITTTGNDKPSYIVTTVTSDAADEEGQLLLHHLLHSSHYHLHTAGLDTGYCRDVHGQLTVQWRDPTSSDPLSSRPRTKTTQYKVLDRGVKLFPSGLANTVI